MPGVTVCPGVEEEEKDVVADSLMSTPNIVEILVTLKQKPVGFSCPIIFSLA